MDVSLVALIVSSIGVLAGLVTLSLVIRNELRARREMPSVIWGFHRFASATVDGVPCEAAELVQYGRTPTHVLSYAPVGLELLPKVEYRIQRYVKAEDKMPLFLTSFDPDGAWLLLSHRPRNDKRWLYFDYVELEPTSKAYMDRVDAALDRLEKEQATWAGRLQRLRWRLGRGSIVRPVGPDGYGWARLRTDRRRWSEEEFVRITSLATAGGAGFVQPY